MRKLLTWGAILPVLAALLAGCGGKTGAFDPDAFLSALKAGGFVQAKALDALTDYEEETDSDGKLYFNWNKTYPDGSIIQLNASAEGGELVDYRYRMIDYGDIGLEQDPKNLTSEEEQAIVMRFIGAFRPDLAGLAWTYEWQEPKHFWAWVASEGAQTYGVLVNDFGEVWRFSPSIGSVLI